MNHIIIHYDEIGIKGKNRKKFENRLVRNMRRALLCAVPHCGAKVRRISGRIVITATQTLDTDAQHKITHCLQRVFGIAFFAFSRETKPNIDAITAECIAVLKAVAADSPQGLPFRISARRSDKTFPLTSQQMNEHIGRRAVEELAMRVNLSAPRVQCHIEVADNRAFVYTQKHAGPGGLPVGIAGRVAVMLSGGIDSPVAAYYCMKRGAEIIAIHFHSVPYTSSFSVDKVRQLCGVLAGYQGRIKLWSIPFADMQKMIMHSAPARLRILLYRRAMLRVTELIARAQKAQAMVTGEALGQVASQTLENIAVVSAAATMPVLRPLIGFDKYEIIEKAGLLGTLAISQQPHNDCCTLFLPPQVETRAQLSEILAAEQLCDMRFIKKMADAAELFTING